jgi:hypothetical protein
VDIVLNCLAGEFIDKSVAVLSTRGRFIEIGKTAVWSAEKFKAVRPQGKYLLVDLTTEANANPAMVEEMFSALAAGFGSGELRALPHETFSILHAPTAFRYMAQARHIGKIVISRPHGLRAADAADAARFRTDGAYVITGGLGGLGRRLARWLVEHGARHVVLLSRRRPSENVLNEIRALEEPGVTIAVESADVSDFQAMKAVLERIPSGLPLRGVIHAAGALDDGVLMQQDWSRFRNVFAAKVDGAWNLHRLTRDLQLDFFVLFSSVASLFGSPGQANHSAANAFLDNLAHYRRTLGLEGLSINWGAWSEIGAFAERNVGLHLASRGIGTFNPEQGIGILESAMAGEAVQIGVAPVNWPHFLKQFSSNRVPRFYEGLTDQPQASTRPQAGDSTKKAYIDELLAAPSNKRRKLLLAFVQQAVVNTLGTDPSRLTDLRRPLSDLGLDSLLAVEMRNVLSTGLGLETPLPAGLLFDCPSIEALINYLDTAVLGPKTPDKSDVKSAEAPPGAADEAEDWADMERLTEDEAESLLRMELEGES